MLLNAVQAGANLPACCCYCAAAAVSSNSSGTISAQQTQPRMHDSYTAEFACTGRGRASYKHVPGLARTLREGALLQMYVTKSIYKSQQRTVSYKSSVIPSIWYYASTLTTSRGMTSFLIETLLLKTANTIQTATATSTRSMHVVNRAAVWRIFTAIAAGSGNSSDTRRALSTVGAEQIVGTLVAKVLYSGGLSSGQVVASAIPATQQFRALDIFVIQSSSISALVGQRSWNALATLVRWALLKQFVFEHLLKVLSVQPALLAQ
eukprot:17853-Heterococcus_DN1.PRE.1